jgi:hypothetical protein
MRKRPTLARRYAGRLNGRKMNMKAMLVTTISMPSPMGSACWNRNAVKKMMPGPRRK